MNQTKVLRTEVKLSTYDKLLSCAYRQKSTVAELISALVEGWAAVQPEAEMSTIDVELEEGVLDFLRSKAEETNQTIDEVIINAMIEQLGTCSEEGGKS